MGGNTSQLMINFYFVEDQTIHGEPRLKSYFSLYKKIILKNFKNHVAKAVIFELI